MDCLWLDMDYSCLAVPTEVRCRYPESGVGAEHEPTGESGGLMFFGPSIASAVGRARKTRPESKEERKELSIVSPELLFPPFSKRNRGSVPRFAPQICPDLPDFQDFTRFPRFPKAEQGTVMGVPGTPGRCGDSTRGCQWPVSSLCPAACCRA